MAIETVADMPARAAFYCDSQDVAPILALFPENDEDYGSVWVLDMLGEVHVYGMFGIVPWYGARVYHLGTSDELYLGEPWGRD